MGKWEEAEDAGIVAERNGQGEQRRKKRRKKHLRSIRRCSNVSGLIGSPSGSDREENRMTAMRWWAAVCCLAALVGCASIFGRSTKDPAVMLTWASEEFSSKDDPIAAEELLQQALQIYRKKMDRLGQAEAYRQYGLFLRSTAVGKFKDHYNTIGFLDESVKYSNRYEKSLEYFTKSRAIFEEHKRYDVVSAIDVSMAKTYDIMDRREEACAAFSRSIESHARFKMEDQEGEEQRSLEIANYREYVDLMRKQAGCPDSPAATPVERVRPTPKPVPTSPYAPPLEPAPAAAPAPALESAPPAPPAP
jgi:tetratricopeptide (TPR) repeat protein